MNRLQHTFKWPGHNHVQTKCNTSSAYHMQHVVLHATRVIRRDSSAIKFDRVEIALILAIFYWLNH